MSLTERLLYFLPAVAFLSCSSGTESPVVDESDRLYAETIGLIDSFGDSIRLAPDSASALLAFEHFGAQYDSLNMSVNPNTDLLLTEVENDTIIKRLDTLRELLDSRLHNFAMPDTLRPDTISSAE